MKVTIRAATWLNDKDLLRAVRSRVFIEEQAVPVELEWDDKDEQARHWLAVDADDNAVGTVRMLADGHIGRMAVLADHRQQGVGRALLEAAIAHARDSNQFDVYLYAQVQALAFYRKLGFEAYGPEFMDANIPHLAMRLQLADKRLAGTHGGDFAVQIPSHQLGFAGRFDVKV
ncbi:MAG: GNAT family N-acetyltransferase, partial [Opitutales bacterium]|nr:GNAT family N-acetyltransferase [Opitutales bacterium]